MVYMLCLTNCVKMVVKLILKVDNIGMQLRDKGLLQII